MKENQLTREDFQSMKETGRKAIETSIVEKTGIEVSVRLYTDRINIRLAGCERYDFDGNLNSDLDTGEIKGVKYNIGSWGSFAPSDTISEIYQVFGILMSDKSLQQLIEDTLVSLDKTAKQIFA